MALDLIYSVVRGCAVAHWGGHVKEGHLDIGFRGHWTCPLPYECPARPATKSLIKWPLYNRNPPIKQAYPVQLINAEAKTTRQSPVEEEKSSVAWGAGV